MSFLTPLFILGGAAISLPIVLHLIRRTPRGQQAFSSLMFLSPSPPRLSRRSRLDNLLLLLLRGLAILLLALAFARPFLRENTSLSLEGVRGRRIAILLDTSASMQRADLWAQAPRQVEDLLDSVEPADDVALFTFDDQVRTKVDFAEPSGLQRELRSTQIRRELEELAPTWSQTDLALALTTAADSLAAAHDRGRPDAASQIVLISDLQRGSRLDRLETYHWPDEVSLAVRQVVPASRTNASLRILGDDPASGDDEHVRVRVSNAEQSEADQFYLRWSEAESDSAADEEVAAYVPAGQSRVIRVPSPPASRSVDRLVLRGDGCDFDNTFYTVPVRQEETTVLYVGTESADDAEGLRYYLQLALSESPRRNVELQVKRPDQPLDWTEEEAPQLVVTAEQLSDEQLDQLQRYVRDGGSFFAIARGEQAAVQLVRFDQDVRVVEQEQEDATDYAMLGEIDFSHPLFRAFAEPQYNDFTKIHFWDYTRFALGEDSPAHVVARFDDGFPALWEQPYGEGKVFVFSSSWQPRASQLALSSKFVPLVTGVLEHAVSRDQLRATYAINEQVVLPPWSGTAAVRKPDGSRIVLDEETGTFGEADLPGIYHTELGDDQRVFAVNLASSESDTTPLDLDRLGQFGIPLGEQRTQSEEVAHRRQLRDRELESQQKLWKWLIIAALCALSVETFLAGRAARR